MKSNTNKLQGIDLKLVNPELPNLLFIKQNSKLKGEYDKGFGANQIFIINGTGIVTKRDKLTIDFDKEQLYKRVEFFINNPEEEVRKKLELPLDVRDWRFEWALKDLNPRLGFLGRELKRLIIEFLIIDIFTIQGIHVALLVGQLLGL